MLGTYVGYRILGRHGQSDSCAATKWRSANPPPRHRPRWLPERWKKQNADEWSSLLAEVNISRRSTQGVLHYLAVHCFSTLPRFTFCCTTAPTQTKISKVVGKVVSTLRVLNLPRHIPPASAPATSPASLLHLGPAPFMNRVAPSERLPIADRHSTFPSASAPRSCSSCSQDTGVSEPKRGSARRRGPEPSGDERFRCQIDDLATFVATMEEVEANGAAGRMCRG